MKYINNWEKVQQRYLEFWARENHDKPLLSIHAPKEECMKVKTEFQGTIAQKWLDTEYIIQNSREAFEATFYGGEAYPVFNPNLGPDILGAILGSELEFGEDTSWAQNVIKEDWNNVGKLEFNSQNKWWKKIKEITEAAVNDAKGDYFVGITDLHPGLDAIVSLRGSENTCMDLYDNPEAIKKATFEILEVFKTIVDEIYAITVKNIKGSTNWKGIWHPGKWYVTSSDIICMISKDMLADFVLPELTEELKWLDASIFHLDGPGAFKHLDSLLEIPELNGIQWQYGAGAPTAAHWIPELKKIQNAGKLIDVPVLPEEIDLLLEELSPEGVIYEMYCRTEQDARDILDKVNKSYKKKVF